MFYTFYSYKGGVGRSMALANIAVLMSNAKLNVIMIDWDLEAPGIERFFSPEIVKKAMNNQGVIDMLLNYKRHVSQYNPESGKSLFPVVNIEDYLVDVTEDKHLRLLPAGYRSQEQFAEYAKRVKTFEWDDFYENWEGELFFEWLRDQFMEIADVVLIDSRTGVTEMGGVCTYQLADVVILFCAASDQNIDGTLQMVKSFADDELQELRHGRPLYAIPVPSRVERIAETTSLNDFREKFVDSFTKWLPEQFKTVPDFFVKLEIQYVPIYAFEEIVAVNQNNTKLRSVELEEAYINLLKVIFDISSNLPRIKDSKIFISYAREDSETAQRIYSDLKCAGLKPWLDIEGIQPDQNWKEVIAKLIQDSPFFLALLSKNSVSERGYVQEELKIAMELIEDIPESKLYIIPVRIDDVQLADEKLQNLQRFDLFRHYEKSLYHIIRAIVSKIQDKSDKELSEIIIEKKELTYLNLSNKRISELPIEISQVQKVQMLDIENNLLAELPSFICQLKNLKILSLDNNKLTNLPAEIGQLENLQMLYLRNNQLIKIPLEIKELKNLKELHLENNPLPIPPEILKLSDEPYEIINYYLQHQLPSAKKKVLNEAKMIIVGQGSVGKTSLVKRLIKDRFDPREPKTDGIDIQAWPVTVNDDVIQLNVWDFGGQEIMHATHQFFLSKRSLYILVLDSRVDEQDNRLEYWLKIIQSFGGDAPIIVVCNKCDIQDIDLDWQELRKKYPTIKDFAKRVSCYTGEGIDKLRKIIEWEVSKLEHIQDELLLSWFTVKKRLENMEDDYISYSEYQKICETEKVTDENSQRTLIGFLHDLGVVLHFREHLLEDTNVLNPEWVTTGIYQILNSDELSQTKGVLETEAFDRILEPRRYPKNKHYFLIEMMRKFELCFDIEGYFNKRFLVPDLLRKEKPQIGDWSDSLAFQYHYNVLPASIISRFIVKMNMFIFNNIYWRYGVVLQSEDGQNKALVQADIEEKKIFIYVTGSELSRYQFLGIIRSAIFIINSSIPKIQVKEKVPIPKNHDVTISYEHLLFLEEKGIENYWPEGLDYAVNVKELLKEIERISA